MKSHFTCKSHALPSLLAHELWKHQISTQSWNEKKSQRTVEYLCLLIWLLTAPSAEVELTLDEAVSESDLVQEQFSIQCQSWEHQTETVHVCASSVFPLRLRETRLDLWTMKKKKRLTLKLTMWVCGSSTDLVIDEWADFVLISDYFLIHFSSDVQKVDENKFHFIYALHSWFFTCTTCVVNVKTKGNRRALYLLINFRLNVLNWPDWTENKLRKV